MRAFLADVLPDATARGLAAGLTLYVLAGVGLGVAIILRLHGAA